MNRFDTGDIIQHTQYNKLIFLITEVIHSVTIPNRFTYHIMHLPTGDIDTISFDNAHREYKKIA